MKCDLIIKNTKNNEKIRKVDLKCEILKDFIVVTGMDNKKHCFKIFADNISDDIKTFIGYPRIVNAMTEFHKREMPNNYYKDMIERDELKYKILMLT